MKSILRHHRIVVQNDVYSNGFSWIDIVIAKTFLLSLWVVSFISFVIALCIIFEVYGRLLCKVFTKLLSNLSVIHLTRPSCRISIVAPSCKIIVEFL